MHVSIEMPDQEPGSGQRYQWDDGFELRTHGGTDGVIIVGNAAGLRSLARHLLVLAQDDVTAGSHLHLDSFGGLEEGSIDLILERAL